MLALQSPIYSIAQSAGFHIDNLGHCHAVRKSGNRITLFPKPIACLLSQLGNPKQWLSWYLELFPIIPRISHGEIIQEVFDCHRPGSCMRGSKHTDKRSIYVNNTDKIGIAWNKQEDHPALCSSYSVLIFHGKKRDYVDRIYSNGYIDDIVRPHIASQLAKMLRDSKGLFESYSTFEMASKLTMVFNHGEDEPLPYSDSFYLQSHTENTVTLSTDPIDCEHELTSQDGPTPSGNCGCRYRCHNCDCGIFEDDSHPHNDELYCEDCYSECFGYCEYCEETYPTDELSYVTVYYRGRERDMTICDESLRQDFTRTTSGNWCHDDDIIELISGDYISPSEYENGDYVYSEYDGEYMAVGDAIYCDDIDDYRQSENCTEYNGRWYGEKGNIVPDFDELWDSVESVSVAIARVGSTYRELKYAIGLWGIVASDNDTFGPYQIVHLPSGLLATSGFSNLEENTTKLNWIVSQIPENESNFLSSLKAIPDYGTDEWRNYRNNTEKSILLFGEIGR